MNGRILNSWKEISQYVGRSVRTIQRWERDIGFPIRRPRKSPRSGVLAYSHEIDAWLLAPATRIQPGSAAGEQLGWTKFHENTERLRIGTEKLMCNIRSLESNVAMAMSLGRNFRKQHSHSKASGTS